MESFIDTQHGIPTLLASIAVVLALHLVFKLGEFVWKLSQKDSEKNLQSLQKLIAALESNSKEVEKLSCSMKEIEKDLAEMPKFKLDLRRVFTAVKLLSGDRWQKIRDDIMEDELP